MVGVNKMNNNNLHTAGFTMIEIVITVFLLAILVVPLSGLFIQGYKTHRLALEKQYMSLAAQSIIEINVNKPEICENRSGEYNGFAYELFHLDESSLSSTERDLSDYGLSKIKLLLKSKKYPETQLIWALYAMNKAQID